MAGISQHIDSLVPIVFLFSVLITSSVAAYFLEVYSRKTFLDQQILAKEQERLKVEQAKSDELLVNMLPLPIAEQMKSGEQTVACKFEEVSILFVHIVGMSTLLQQFSLTEMFQYVHEIFCKFDEMVQKHKLEKIKTIGTTYMVAGNVPLALEGHEEAMIDLAFEMLRFISEFSAEKGRLFELRIGINLGPCSAGVIGTKKWVWDLWRCRYDA